MKAYEDEMERVAAKVAKAVLLKFGFRFGRTEKPMKKCYPRAAHIQQLCEACRVGVCLEGKRERA